VEYVKKLGIENVFQIQISFEETVFNENVIKDKTKKSDIIFIGNYYGNTYPLGKLRLQTIKYLKNIYKNKFTVIGGNWVGYGDPPVYAKINTPIYYNSHKIALSINNINAYKYTSDRLFNIMATKTFCLVHYYEGLEEDFENKKHLVWWKDVKELKGLIDYYLSHDDERNQIANNGFNEVWSKHRWLNRMDIIKERVLK
jgi:spore maturation protein CgeB